MNAHAETTGITAAAKASLLREPLTVRAGITALITLALAVLTATGIGVSPDTRDNLITAAVFTAPIVPLILAAWARRHVTPTADPRDDAGHPLIAADLPGLPHLSEGGA